VANSWPIDWRALIGRQDTLRFSAFVSVQASVQPSVPGDQSGTVALAQRETYVIRFTRWPLASLREIALDEKAKKVAFAEVDSFGRVSARYWHHSLSS